MRLVRQLGLLFSVALVLVVSIWESQKRVAPGALHPAHASVIELQGASGCEACHGDDGFADGARVEAAACLKCHAAIGSQLDGRRGLHGALAPGRAGDCGGCHVDHHAKDAPLVTSASFALAGIPDRAAYRHEHVPDYPLKGRHLELRCVDCHLHADDVEVPRGRGRFLGLGSSCTPCHEDPHGGGFGGECAQCHGQEEPFDAAPGFDHGSFALDGMHHRVACVQCHPSGTRHDFRLARRNPPPVRACAECHESPHAPKFLATALAGTGAAPGDCSRCHDPARLRFHRATLTPAQHEATGFSLKEPHDGIACTECHGAPGRGFEQRFRGTPRSDCRLCHEDHHRGQFDLRRWPRCTNCHAETHFKPSPFDHRAHDRTRFPLVGQHAAVACATCHPRVVDGVRQYAGTDGSCGSCHADVHGGVFDRESVPAPVGGQGDCGRCHSPHGFGVRAARFEHVWTGFPLGGAHARLECAQCHARTADPDAQGRHFRRAAGRDCAACHEDRHLGQFAEGGRVDCAKCHQTGSFAATVFDHQRHSRYPLDETHAKVACNKCHLPFPTDKGPVVRYKPLGVECGDCHVLGERGAVRR
jgi:hypothetical protein